VFGLYSTMYIHKTPMATMIMYKMITAKSVPLEKLFWLELVDIIIFSLLFYSWLFFKNNFIFGDLLFIG